MLFPAVFYTNRQIFILPDIYCLMREGDLDPQPVEFVFHAAAELPGHIQLFEGRCQNTRSDDPGRADKISWSFFKDRFDFL